MGTLGDALLPAKMMKTKQFLLGGMGSLTILLCVYFSGCFGKMGSRLLAQIAPEIAANVKITSFKSDERFKDVTHCWNLIHLPSKQLTDFANLKARADDLQFALDIISGLYPSLNIKESDYSLRRWASGHYKFYWVVRDDFSQSFLVVLDI